MILAALLAGIAGYVDAICFLCLGNVFAANMTGNLVEIGITMATGSWRRASLYTAVAMSFLLGVVIARLLRRDRAPLLPLLAETGVILLAASGRLDVATVPLLAAAMAMQNAAVTHGIVAVNVTFVTGDIQQLGDALFRDRSTAGLRPEDRKSAMILAVLVFYALGAAVGTFASPLREPALLAPAAVLIAILLLPGVVSPRGARP